MSQSRSFSNDLRAELRVQPPEVGLRARHLRPNRGLYRDHVHILLLTEGAMQLEAGEITHDLHGPAALILPPSSEHLLTVGAGASCWIFGLSGILLSELAGARPEFKLMLPLNRSIIMAPGLTMNGPLAAPVLAEAIATELESAAPGHHTAVLSCLRLIVLAIWRQSHPEPPAVRPHSDAHILEDFRREVEMHFRSHLPVAEYARALGLSESRLRRICQRGLDRSPLQLIHQRMMREALIWLEHSDHSVAGIAQELGFADSAEFSHFFKRLSGRSPSHFRDEQRSSSHAAASEQASESRFADWP